MASSQASIKELQKIASILKIRRYQEYKKADLLQLINNKYNQPYIEESTDDYNITPHEAYVMGLFFADGNAGIYEWEHTYKASNRPRAYTRTRTSYNWAISNTNLDFVEKRFPNKNIVEVFKL